MGKKETIPISVPNLGELERRYLNACIDSGFVSSVGPFVTRLETLLASITGVGGAVATASGTAALHAALATAGVGPNGLVVMPSYTFVATANATWQCGADPFFVDITETGWTMDPEALIAALKACRRCEDGWVHEATGRPVQAILPVCTLGWLPDMAAISAIAREFELPVILDAAAALGAKRHGLELGDLDFDFATLSFNGNKTVTAGAGGAVIGRDAVQLAKLRHLTTTGKAGPDYSHDVRAFNYRMSNLQAAVGVAQLERLDVFLAAKREHFQAYNDAIASLSQVEPLPCPNIDDSSCWLSGMVLNETGPDKRAVLAAMANRGIDAGHFWQPLHRLEPYKDAPRMGLSVSEAIWDRVIILPCSSHLSADDRGRVIAVIEEFFR